MSEEAKEQPGMASPPPNQTEKATAEPGILDDFDPESATKEQWQALVAAKDAEIQELNERILRLAAEMENTRKRLQREKSDSICFANEQLIKDMLPVLDNLDRAIEHAEKEADVQTLLEGVRMTRQSFLSALERHGCKPFDSVGEPFDPNFHEAMLQQESSEQPENTVLSEYQKGYMLRERLLRPALVTVAKSPADAPGEADGQTSTGSEDTAETADN